VIGCGNLHYDGSLRVPLSTVDQHSQKIGEHAGNILLRLIESKIRPGSTSIILDPALLVRASTKKDVGSKDGGLMAVTEHGATLTPREQKQ
jgi:LacI family transcriptional regulator